MPNRDNVIGYAFHQPKKHVVVLTLPSNEEPEDWEDEVLVELRNTSEGTVQLHLTPGAFNTLVAAFASAHTSIHHAP